MVFASPFGGRLSDNASQPRRTDVNSQRFAELKSVCVQLLGQCSPVGQHDDIQRTLQRLADKLASFTPAPALSPSLISYIFFPLAQLFRALPNAPDRIQRLQFVILQRLVSDWWPAWVAHGEKADEQRKVWEQLVILAVMALNKDDQSEETSSAVVDLLQGLLAPRFVKEKPSQQQEKLVQWEWDGVSELPDLDDYEREIERLQIRSGADDCTSSKLVYPDSDLLSFAKISVHAQILVKALNLARQDGLSRTLRTSSLRLVRTLLQVWIAQESVSVDRDLSTFVSSGQRAVRKEGKVSERVEQMNSFLPGVVSSVMGILKGGKIASSPAKEALRLLRSTLVFCLSDEHIGQRTNASSPAFTKAANLEELISQARIEEDYDSPEAEAIENKKAFEFDASLQETASRVAIVLRSIQPLTQNPNADVRMNVVELAGHLLKRCRSLCELADVHRMLFIWLLDVASAHGGSLKASERASDFILDISTDRPDLVKAELVNAALSLPRFLLLIRHDEQLTQASNRLGFLVRLASGSISEQYTQFDALQASFTTEIFQRWILSIIGSFAIDTSSQSSLRGFEASTSHAFLHFFEELGAAAARWQLSQDGVSMDSTSMIAYLIKLSHPGAMANVGTANNATVLAARMMAGVAATFDESRLAKLPGKEGVRVRKQSRKLARQVIILLTDAWQASEEELLLPEAKSEVLTDEERQLVDEHSDPHDRLLTEYQQGMHPRHFNEPSTEQSPIEASSLLNVDFVQSASIQQARTSKLPTERKRNKLALIKQAEQIDASKLSILASAATILGPAIKPMLVQTVYPMICAVASTSEDLQTAASLAIDRISYAAGYASVQGCLLDHADYILGAATHRLVSTLGHELQQRSLQNQTDKSVILPPLMSALSAPLVLVELIRMLGSEVVVLVEDAIDEVLEAIDRFHSDEEICDNLLSVLDRMLEVMLEHEQTQSGKSLPAPQIGFQADNDRDLKDFERWLQHRKLAESDDTEDVGTLEQPNPETEGEVTRTQKTTVSMLKKAVPFLSHSSRIVRMRCLRLVNRGTELLCRQGLKVEPLSVLNMCWPILMGRLGFSLSRPLPKHSSTSEMLEERDFFVALEAVKLISTASRFLIDYLGNEKIMRQAVPRLLLLIALFERAENARFHSTQAKLPTTFLLSDSDQAKPEPPQRRFQPLRPHSPLLILLQHVLSTLDNVVSAMGAAITEADLYHFAVHPTLLACLDTRQHESIRSLAMQFYHCTLAKRNASLVWLVIEGARPRSTGIDFPPFLDRPELSL